MNTPTTLFVCRICGQTERDETGRKHTSPQSAALAEALAAELAGSGITVTLTECLSICTKPTAWGLRAEGKHAFAFAPALPEHAADIAATARTYHALPAGEKMAKNNMAPAVKGTLISRLPPA